MPTSRRSTDSNPSGRVRCPDCIAAWSGQMAAFMQDRWQKKRTIDEGNHPYDHSESESYAPSTEGLGPIQSRQYSYLDDNGSVHPGADRSL